MLTAIYLYIFEYSSPAHLQAPTTFLSCYRTKKGYPLKIEVVQIEYEQSPFDQDFIISLLQKIEYTPLLYALAQISESFNETEAGFSLPILPKESPLPNDNNEFNVDELKNIHTALHDIHIVEGFLICPDTERRFPITMGIPNMVSAF